MKSQFVILFLVLILNGCGAKNGIVKIVGIEPEINEKREYGIDYVRNVLFKKSSVGQPLFEEVQQKLTDSGKLYGGVRKDNFESNPFLINELGRIENKQVLKKAVYYFSTEEIALIIYDLEGWVLIEVSKW